MFNFLKKKKDEEPRDEEKEKIREELENAEDEGSGADEMEADDADVSSDDTELTPEEELEEQQNAEEEASISSNEIPEGEGADTEVTGTVTPDENKKNEFGNPRLKELISEFNDKKEDPKYLAELWFHVAHARYLVPIRFTEPPEILPNGVAKVSKENQIQFANLTDPTDPEKHVLPVFTDYETLGLWKGLAADGKKPEITIINFVDIVRIIGNTLSGFAINPFGPGTLTLGREAIEMIQNLPGYKAEVERARLMAEARREGREVQVSILEPKETDEEKAIERELITIAAASEDIQKIGLVVTRPQIENAPLSYLCIVDCPEDKAGQIFPAIGKAVKPHLQMIKRMDFMPISKCTFADSYFKNHSFVYPPF